MNCSIVILAGFLASVGGVLGKYSGNISNVHFIFPTISFVAMLICNSTSWSLYVKALQNYSALSTTVSCSAVNFILSGIFGAVIFSEPTGYYWIAGVTLVLTGLCVILSSEGKEKVN